MKRFGRSQKRKLKAENERLSKLVHDSEEALIQAEKRVNFPYLKNESMVVSLIPDLFRSCQSTELGSPPEEQSILQVQIDPMPLMFSSRISKSDLVRYADHPEYIVSKFFREFSGQLMKAIPVLCRKALGQEEGPGSCGEAFK